MRGHCLSGVNTGIDFFTKKYQGVGVYRSQHYNSAFENDYYEEDKTSVITLQQQSEELKKFQVHNSSSSNIDHLYIEDLFF